MFCRPNGTDSVPIGDPESIELFKGPLYDELHAFYNELISMVITYTLFIRNDKITINCNSYAILVSIKRIIIW